MSPTLTVPTGTVFGREGKRAAGLVCEGRPLRSAAACGGGSRPELLTLTG